MRTLAMMLDSVGTNAKSFRKKNQRIYAVPNAFGAYIRTFVGTFLWELAWELSLKKASKYGKILLFSEKHFR